MDLTEIELALSMVKRIQREARAAGQLLARLRDERGEEESIMQEQQLQLQPQEVQANGNEGNDGSSMEDR